MGCERRAVVRLAEARRRTRRRCDIRCTDYLAKYEARAHRVLERSAALLPNYPLSVASSLSLSLSQIAKESRSSRRATVTN